MLDPLDVLGVAEVISIGWFLEPAPLTGGLTGAAAIRRRTIKLAIGIVAVRREENVTAAALASVIFGAHRAPSRKKIIAPLQSKNAPGKTGRNKEGRRVFRWKRKKISRKKTDFQTATFPPLSSRP